MSLSVDFSKWHVRRGIGELSRIYHFSGLQTPDATVTLRLDCRLESSVGGFINSILTLYIRPFRLLHETSLVMGLVTADQSKGGTVEVRACPVEGDRNAALLTVGHGMEGRQDVQKCLSAIASGKEMFFMLGNQTRPFVKLPLPNGGEFQRLYYEIYERMARAQDASRDGRYSKRFLRGVDALLGAASTRQRSFAAAFKHGRRLLAKTAFDTFTRLKAASFGLTKGYSFLDKINATAELLKARTVARAVARAQHASRDGRYSLRGVDALLGAASTGQKSFAAAFKNGRRLLAKADEPIAPDAVRWPTSSSSRHPFRDTAASDIPLNGVKWIEAHRGWAVFGVSAFAGVVVLFVLIGSSSIQSTSTTKPLSNSGASPAGPAQAAANVKMQAETVAYPNGLLEAANKELPKQEQTPAPAEVRPVNHPIGEIGTLKQAFVGCRDSWQDDGLLELASKLPANECNVRLPAGTEVIVANIRANNNICLRFPDDTVCYWATGDVLKPSKPVPPARTQVHPVKARRAKAHPAIRPRDDDQLNFLR